MSALSENAVYIIRAASHGWQDRIWLKETDPVTEAVTGPMSLTGLVLTASFTRADTGAVTSVSEGSGITIVDEPGGEVLVGLTWAQLEPIPVGTQVELRLTVWDGDLPLVNVPLVYAVKAG